MTIRWGIVSAGKISHDFVNSYNSYQGEKGDGIMYSVAARDKKRASEFAKLHNIPKVFDTYQDMADSKEIDVVYIGALTCDHYPLSKLFLENGKHVLCEKPLCLNEKQVQSLVDLAKGKKLFLMEAVWSRFNPIYQALGIELPKLGEISYVEASFGVPIADVERIKRKDLGGGALLDLGIYVLQFAQYIYKEEPIKVTTVGEVTPEGVDFAETIILEYTRNRKAVLNVHANLRLLNNAIVVGTNGRVILQDPFHCPTTWVTMDGTVEKINKHKSKLPYNYENSELLVYEAMEVNRCIETKMIESPFMTHHDSLTLAKIEDTVRSQLGVKFEGDA